MEVDDAGKTDFFLGSHLRGSDGFEIPAILRKPDCCLR